MFKVSKWCLHVKLRLVKVYIYPKYENMSTYYKVRARTNIILTKFGLWTLSLTTPFKDIDIILARNTREHV